MDFDDSADGLSNAEEKYWKKRLYMNAGATFVSVSAQIAVGGITSLYTYNKIYHLQLLDRIGESDPKLKSEILKLLFVDLSKKGILDEKNIYTLVLKKSNCALRTVKNSLLLDFFRSIISTVVYSFATYPFTFYFHRYLLKEKKKSGGKERKGSFWGGFIYHLMGDFAFEISRTTSIFLLENFFKYGKKAKNYVFGEESKMVFEDDEEDEEDSFDQLIDLFNRYALTYFISTFFGLLAAEPFFSKSLNLQLGRIEFGGYKELFKFSDLPKRKNISELLMLKTSLKTIQNTLCSSSIYFSVNTIEAYHNVTGSQAALSIYKWINEQIEEVTS